METIKDFGWALIELKEGKKGLNAVNVRLME